MYVGLSLLTSSLMRLCSDVSIQAERGRNSLPYGCWTQPRGGHWSAQTRRGEGGLERHLTQLHQLRQAGHGPLNRTGRFLPTSLADLRSQRTMASSVVTMPQPVSSVQVPEYDAG